jgi:hypothetical protein
MRIEADMRDKLRTWVDEKKRKRENDPPVLKGILRGKDIREI